jgi:outer membrane cobalamin receptor
MKTLRSSVSVPLALLLCFPVSAYADDVSNLAGLLDEPVVSTASMTAETAGLAPATTSVITAEDLRRHGIGSLDEAINFLALGMIAEPSYGTPEIGARGVLLSGDYGNHMLLLVDGHALNEPWDGTAYYDRSAAIPIDLVDHIEVILGPGSVLYGSSAMLGVINVITKRAKDYPGLHLVADGGYPASGRAAGGYGTEFELMGRQGELTAGVDYYRSWGPRMTFGLQQIGDATWGGVASHRSIEVPAGHVRFILGDFELAVRGAASRRAATEIWGSFDDPNNWERDRWLSLDARYGTSLSQNLRVSLRLYGDLYDYFDNAPSASALDCLEGQARCVFKNSGVSRWGGGEVSGTWDWFGDGRYVALLGLDARYRHVASWTSYDDASTGASTVVSPYDSSGATLGGYLQQTLRLAPWLNVNAGLRLDHDDQLGAHLSPRVAAVMPAWTGGTVKAVYSEAFRAPTFYERYYADATFWIAPSGLRPETVRSIEGVVEQRRGSDRLRLGVFRSWWDDLVLQVSATPDQIAAAQVSGALTPGVTTVYTYANASRVESYGLNADWEGSGLRQRLRYGTGLTLAHSRQVGSVDSALLPAAAQAFGNARVSYELGGRLPVLALAARVVGPRPVSGASFTPAPDAKPQLELRGAVSGPISGGLSYRLSAGWAAIDASAHAVGPVRDPQPGSGAPALLPLPRFQFLAGLRYDR